MKRGSRNRHFLERLRAFHCVDRDRPDPRASVFYSLACEARLQPDERKPELALSGFGNSTVWLIFGAFMFALGYEKTGRGRRVALLLVRAMGPRMLTLG